MNIIYSWVGHVYLLNSSYFALENNTAWGQSGIMPAVIHSNRKVKGKPALSETLSN